MRKCFNFLLIFLVLTTSFFYSKAQKGFSIGIKGGIGIPNLVAQGDDPVTKGYTSILGPYFGVVSEYKFGGKFSLQAELNYSSQGGQKNGKQALPTGSSSQPYLYATFDAKASITYLELPILAKYTFSINKKLSFFINGGPYLAYRLAGKAVTRGSSVIYKDEAMTQPLSPTVFLFDSTPDQENITDELKPFNVGIQGGMGLALKAGKGNIFFTAGGNFGFISIQKDKANGENYAGAATITIGYLLPLRRNKG
jgi:hypothetical protein